MSVAPTMVAQCNNNAFNLANQNGCPIAPVPMGKVGDRKWYDVVGLD